MDQCVDHEREDERKCELVSSDVHATAKRSGSARSKRARRAGMPSP
jgi:hypothetical protein